MEALVGRVRRGERRPPFHAERRRRAVADGGRAKSSSRIAPGRGAPRQPALSTTPRQALRSRGSAEFARAAGDTGEGLDGDGSRPGTNKGRRISTLQALKRARRRIRSSGDDRRVVQPCLDISAPRKNEGNTPLQPAGPSSGDNPTPPLPVPRAPRGTPRLSSGRRRRAAGEQDRALHAPCSGEGRQRHQLNSAPTRTDRPGSACVEAAARKAQPDVLKVRTLKAAPTSVSTEPISCRHGLSRSA